MGRHLAEDSARAGSAGEIARFETSRQAESENAGSEKTRPSRAGGKPPRPETQNARRALDPPRAIVVSLHPFANHVNPELWVSSKTYSFNPKRGPIHVIPR
jgi:hypothetical protein